MARDPRQPLPGALPAAVPPRPAAPPPAAPPPSFPLRLPEPPQPIAYAPSPPTPGHSRRRPPPQGPKVPFPVLLGAAVFVMAALIGALLF
ncbi:hypothetical protein GCM10020000_35700 [Streptomyces olivoverticillatus]